MKTRKTDNALELRLLGLIAPDGTEGTFHPDGTVQLIYPNGTKRDYRPCIGRLDRKWEIA